MEATIRHLILAAAAVLALSLAAPSARADDAVLQILPAAETTPGDWQWVARPLVVFADSPADPRFVQQMQMIEADAAQLLDRHVVVIVDTDPAARSAWRQLLRPRGFMLTLIGMDGDVKMRRPAPRNARELSAVIDKTPIRQQELRDRGQRVR